MENPRIYKLIEPDGLIYVATNKRDTRIKDIHNNFGFVSNPIS